MAQLWRSAVPDNAAAGKTLRELLEQNHDYRRKWQLHAHRRRVSGVSQAAVAQVLALYLWDSGMRSDADAALARSIRDRVRRALGGEKLTAETLDWFVQAFAMSSDDETRLWLAYAGGGKASGGIVGTIRRPRAMTKPQLHRTVSIFERYSIACDRALSTRHTMHVIRAMDAPVHAYMFNHEAHATDIEVLGGGSTGDRYEYGDGLISHEIVLDEPIVPPFATAMEYRTSYPSDFRPLEVRRAVRARCENLDLAIQFQQAPRQTWFCVWADHLLGKPVVEERVELSSTKSAHRFIEFAEQAVVGFRWTWS